ncbi:uncharacterized protein LOC119525368 [Choloepus didactylus]|uniref:uncharacterized protein LOC119525368 n=1 Tax=Choloepus didactylus TaxID=27675 RepID=UPI00189D5072|nr:uncharacterized protein LOC119525368 [Choloepus didactylus]
MLLPLPAGASDSLVLLCAASSMTDTRPAGDCITGSSDEPRSWGSQASPWGAVRETLLPTTVGGDRDAPSPPLTRGSSLCSQASVTWGHNESSAPGLPNPRGWGLWDGRLTPSVSAAPASRPLPGTCRIASRLPPAGEDLSRHPPPGLRPHYPAVLGALWSGEDAAHGAGGSQHGFSFDGLSLPGIAGRKYSLPLGVAGSAPSPPWSLKSCRRHRAAWGQGCRRAELGAGAAGRAQGALLSSPTRPSPAATDLGL